jgi:hypothetical protein
MKWIKITQTQQQAMLKKFQDYITTGRFSDGKITFSETMDKITSAEIKKPKIVFTTSAWLKMRELINQASTEIGWHGVVERNAAKGIYLIKDILVYPQTVTGATVTTDEVTYGNWLMKQPDEIFNNIRFQGHSHVNFGVFASGVDENFYNNILQTLQEGDYYIFMIMNKRDDFMIMLYDYAQNIIFEKADITLKLTDGISIIEDWAAKQIKEHVETYIYVKPEAATATRYHETDPLTPSYNEQMLDAQGDDWWANYYHRLDKREAKNAALNPDTPPKGNKNKKDKDKNKKDREREAVIRGFRL